MIWVDVALKTMALASTIIATLRAGSRAVYLMEHDAIGIMDGPLIKAERDTNETNPLLELSEAFRHSVRLSIAPQFYENVQTAQPVFQKTTVQRPYPLSTRPYLDLVEHDSTNDDENDDDDDEEIITDEELDQMVEQVITKQELLEDKTPSSSSSVFKRIFSTRANERILSSVSSTYQYTRNSLALTPQLASYWAQRVWYWKRWKDEEKSDLEDGAEESDWDYNLSTEARLRFNATEEGTTTPRVAELAVFSPQTFAHLRSTFDISEESYRQSIFGSGPFVSFQSNSKGAARAGGVFFFTRDGAYMIKTIKKEEAKTFLKMLPKYHHYMKRHGRKSLLTRFCGMYGVRIYNEDSSDHGELHTFIVMNAVFPAEASRFIGERFDLKGSTVGREVSEEELKSKGNNAVLKDLDLAREVELVRSLEKDQHTPSANYGLTIGATAKAALLTQLRKDVKLLVDCQVMDYSLLVGVVNMESHIKYEKSARKALVAMQKQGRKFSQSKKFEERALWALGAPLRLVSEPPIFLARQVWSLTQRTVSSIITSPLPYYGSGKCSVDGGLYSVLHGSRNGDRAVYYIGLIDFLQPWTTRKVFERKIKGFMGYDTNAVSCVTPEEYADRFLEFLDTHVS